MKKVFLTIAVASVVLLSACSGNSSKKESTEEQKTEVINDADLVTVTLNVEGMTCTGCENTIKTKVGAIDGVAEVEASHVDGIVKVQLPAGEVSKEDIKAAIVAAGYTVKE